MERTQTLVFVPLRLLALLGAALLFWRAYMHGIDSVGGPSWFLMGTLLALTAISRLNRNALLGCLYIAVYIAFVRFRMVADDAGFSVQYAYPLAIEGPISAWLQEHLYELGRLGILDVLLGAVYYSHFIAVHVVALFLLKRRVILFPRVVGAMTLMLAVALAMHFVVPTAPPWLASEAGYTGANVHRVVAEIGSQIHGNTYEHVANAVDNNLVAAMPSLHAGFAALVALVLAQYGRGAALLGILYAWAMCFALLYFGEHYIVDEIAGIALAYASWHLFGKNADSRLMLALRMRSRFLVRPAEALPLSGEVAFSSPVTPHDGPTRKTVPAKRWLPRYRHDSKPSLVD
jgi:membrane-associated phospholipid phosphatase